MTCGLKRNWFCKNTRSTQAHPTTGTQDAAQFQFAATDPPHTRRAVSASDPRGHARTRANQQTALAGSKRSLLSADRTRHNLQRGVVRPHRPPSVQAPQPSAGRGGSAALRSDNRGKDRPERAEPAVAGMAGQRQDGGWLLKHDAATCVDRHLFGCFTLPVREDYRSCGRQQKSFRRPTDQPVALLQCSAPSGSREGAL